MLKEILENAFIKILGLHPSATRGEINNVYAQAEAEILKHFKEMIGDDTIQIAISAIREWQKNIRFQEAGEHGSPRFFADTNKAIDLLTKLEDKTNE